MLHEFQQAFAAALVAEPAALPPLLAGSADRQSLGVRVYRNNGAHARVEALRDTYPAVVKLIGEECFQTLALDMAARVPMTDPRPILWARELPQFLKRTPLFDALPYLADVARIELACVEVALGEDPPPLDLAVLSNDAVFQTRHILLSPTARVLRSDYPACAIWNAQLEVPDPTREQAGDCIVHRSDLRVIVEALPASTAVRLEQLATPQAVDGFFSRCDDDSAARIGKLIGVGAVIIRKREVS